MFRSCQVLWVRLAECHLAGDFKAPVSLVFWCWFEDVSVVRCQAARKGHCFWPLCQEYGSQQHWYSDIPESLGMQ